MSPDVVKKVVQLLQSGMPEDQIIAEAEQAGLPREVTVQAIEQAKASLGGPNRAGKPEGVPQNSQGLSAIRQIIAQTGPAIVLQIIGAIMTLKGDELNALIADLQSAVQGSQGQNAPAEEGMQASSQQMQPRELQI